MTTESPPPYSPPSRREPALLAPTPLHVLIGVMIGLHAYRTFALGLFSDADLGLLDATAFVPARFSIRFGLTDPESVLSAIMLGEPSVRSLRLGLFRIFVAEGDLFSWSLVSYALLHATWEHAIFNCLWLLAFGSPVMQRFGTVRFMAFFAVTAACAALTHLAVNPLDVSILIGASGAVSGMTAAAIRFAIGPHGFGGGSPHRPAAPLHQALRDRRVLLFIAIWFGINLIMGLGAPYGAGGETLKIAWEAHIGGFVAGLFLFGLFDPRLPSTQE